MTPDEKAMYYRRGRQRLKELLPAMRAMARKEGGQFIEASALFEAMLPYLTEDNLDALVISPAPHGGFHADIALKKTPHGVCNVFGTPMDEPMPTFMDAEAEGKRLLVMLLRHITAAAEGTAEIEAGPPMFILHGWTLPLMPEVLEMITEAAGDRLDVLLPDGESCIARIVEECVTLFGADTFDGDKFIAVPLKAKLSLISAVHQASLRGFLRYPRVEDAPPPEHVGKQRTVIMAGGRDGAAT